MGSIYMLKVEPSEAERQDMEHESIKGVRDELTGFDQATEWNGLPMRWGRPQKSRLMG